MSKDLVLFLPSRNNPKNCDDTIQMLYDTCVSRENFDIVAVVDDDQIDMYDEVIRKFPDVIWKHPPHSKNNWSNINNLHFDFIESTDYYFNWWIADDFYGLGEGWDASIVGKKGIFDDAYFTLFTTNPLGRNLNALTTQYRAAHHWFDGYTKPVVVDPAALIFHYNEMLPICTKKWRMALKPFFENQSGGASHDTLCAALAHVLSVYYGYSRLIEAGVYYENLVDNHNAANVVVNGMTRDQYYYKWAVEENFAMIHPVAASVANDIWQHYRDIMDKPRKIGKFASVEG